MKTELESFDEFCEGWIGGQGGRPAQRNELFGIKSLRRQYQNFVNTLRCNYKRNATYVECPDCKNNMILMKNLTWKCVKYECYFKGQGKG